MTAPDSDVAAAPYENYLRAATRIAPRFPAMGESGDPTTQRADMGTHAPVPDVLCERPPAGSESHTNDFRNISYNLDGHHRHSKVEQPVQKD